MNSLQFKIKSYNPFVIGFMRLFQKMYMYIGPSFTTEDVVISDCLDCDIGLYNAYSNSGTIPTAQIVFTNDIEKCDHSKGIYFYPSINNEEYDDIYNYARFSWQEIEKKYKSVAVLNSKKMSDNLRNFALKNCNVVIIDNEFVKVPIDFEYKPIEKDNIYFLCEFVLLQQDENTECYDYIEALCCNAIPLEIKGQSKKRFLPHPDKYIVDLEDNNFEFPDYNKMELYKIKDLYSENNLFHYIVRLLRSNGVIGE